MAEFLYNTGSMELWDGTMDILTEADMKVMLVTSTYTADRDDDVVDAAGANDPIDHELSGTGYVAGYGNSGRKTLASKTITIDKGNDRSDFDAADVTWTGIDAGTAAQMLLIEERATDDTNSRLYSHHDTNFPVVTNGGDLTVTITDLLRLSTV
jgi:hypothetical protein